MWRVMVATLAIAMLAVGCAEPETKGAKDTKPAATKAGSALTWPEKLAVIDGGKHDAADYRAPLASLVRKCGESEERISDYAVNGRDIVRKKGAATDVLAFLRAMDAAKRDGDGQTCASTSANLATLISR